ncbi:MAG: LacI family DNA-binding transcriptional regulator [Tepidisphaeraceae bacterium]
MTRSGSNLMEVARRCSVSQSTVSRVLNNSKHGRFSVSAAVRERILTVARELNYRPSIAARNLTVSKTNLVAVLGVAGIQSDRVGPAEEAVGALAKALDQSGYEICVQFMSLRHGPFQIPPLRVDGVVAVGPTSVTDLDELDGSGIPYVSLDGVVGSRGSQVVPDDAGGTQMALRHLVELGHRRIAYLDNPSIGAAHPSVFTRREAFARAAAELQFQIPKVEVPSLSGDLPWDSYYEPFLRLSVIEGKATAVLSYSHYGALALLRTAHDLGLSVPTDFSLICFNNEPVTRLSVPSLTAVEVPSAAMGEAAAQILLQGMRGEESSQPICRKLEEKLIVRESTTSPRRPN